MNKPERVGLMSWPVALSVWQALRIGGSEENGEEQATKQDQIRGQKRPGPSF